MLTLPYFFEINMNPNQKNIQEKEGFTVDYARKTFNDLLKILGVKNGTDAKARLLTLMDDISLERSLRNLGIGQDDFQIIVDNGFNSHRVINNPVKVTEGIVRKILGDIL